MKRGSPSPCPFLHRNNRGAPPLIPATTPCKGPLYVTVPNPFRLSCQYCPRCVIDALTVRVDTTIPRRRRGGCVGSHACAQTGCACTCVRALNSTAECRGICCDTNVVRDSYLHLHFSSHPYSGMFLWRIRLPFIRSFNRAFGRINSMKGDRIGLETSWRVYRGL